MYIHGRVAQVPKSNTYKIHNQQNRHRYKGNSGCKRIKRQFVNHDHPSCRHLFDRTAHEPNFTIPE